MFGLGKIPNLNKSVFIGCSKLFDWLWSSNEEFLYSKCWIFRGDAVKIFSKPMFFFFGHNLAITHPNGVIKISG